MANTVDSSIRSNVFAALHAADNGFIKINDRQMGAIIVDADGIERYVRLSVIVAAKNEDYTARDLMASEIADYETKQANKAERAQRSKEKAERDKKRRAAKKEGE